MPQRGEILLVEDNENDIALIRRAFQKAGISEPVHAVQDAEEAMAYLNGEGEHVDRKLPELILLDLNLPGINGFDLLRWIRLHPNFSMIRILVLTSSDAVFYVNKAYKLGANSFLVKPSDFENYKELSRMIGRFWLQTSKAPVVSRLAEQRNDLEAQ